jgi:hypothetical protein
MSILLGQKETRKDAYHCDVKPFAVVLKKTDCQAGYADFFQKVGNSFEAVFDFHRLLLLPSLCHGRRSLSLTFCWWNHQWKRLQNVTASMEIPLIVALLLTHSPPQRLIFGANPVGLMSGVVGFLAFRRVLSRSLGLAACRTRYALPLQLRVG